MRIDGKQIAQDLLIKLSEEVKILKDKGITPTLAVILVGDNPASLSYIKQKQKTAEQIGASVKFIQFPVNVSVETLKQTVEQFNNDKNIHGVIIQRPLPSERADLTPLLNSVAINKDVDGFVSSSTFRVPVAAAVFKILEFVFKNLHSTGNFNDWLKSQCVAVIGRGETAGKPIADLLGEHGCTLSVIHSKTEHPEEIIKKLNIIVSCVGKERVVTKEMLTPETILISVGLTKDSAGKLHGDYEEDEVKNLVAYYTPTPGGVGPVNVACLMQNLVKACKINVGGSL